MNRDIAWEDLVFSYTETDRVIRCHYANGRWAEPYATTDKTIQLHVAATVLQYGQAAFEGLKVFRGEDDRIRIFRMRANAERMQRSAEATYMAVPPVELFERMCLMAVRENLDWVPPTATGATLYLRPVLFGTEAKLGVGPGHEYELVIIPSPIGPYYRGGFGRMTTFVVNRDVDRAAPCGLGPYKVGANYAASFRATEPAHAQGMDALFLDAKEKRYIDECGAANFIGIRDGVFVTPSSRSILPSVTNDSLRTLAADMGLPVEVRPVELTELDSFQEAGACGTAAVISPIDRVIDAETGRIYSFGSAPGPIFTRLYHALQDIQYGRTPDTHGWCTIVER